MNNKDWKIVKFGDVVHNVRNYITDRLGNGIDHIVGLDDIKSGNIHISSWKDVEEKPSFRTHFKPGQTLFGKRRAYLRKVAYAEFEGICTQNILVFESRDSNILLPELLPFICMSEGFMRNAIKHSTGSLFPNANWSSIKEFTFKIPPLEKQNILVRLFFEQDKCLQGYQQLLSATDNSYRMLRNSFALDSRYSLQNDQTLLDQCDVIDCKHRTPKYSENGISIISPGNINYGWLELDECKKVDENEFNSLMDHCIVNSEDIVFARNQRVGYCAIIRPGQKFALGQDTILIKPKNNHGHYIFAILWSTVIYNQIRRISGGSTFSRINLKDVRKFKIPTPTPEGIRFAKEMNVQFLKMNNIISTCIKSQKQLRSSIIEKIFG